MGASESRESERDNTSKHQQLEQTVSEPRPGASPVSKPKAPQAGAAKQGANTGQRRAPTWTGLCGAIKRGSLADLQTELANLVPADNLPEEKKAQMQKRRLRKINELQRGFSPLHLACERGDTAMTRLLLEHGADVDQRNRFKHTALYICIKRYNDECAKICIEFGANVDMSCDWFNALLVGCRRGNLAGVTVLLHAGASTSIPTTCDDLDTPLHVAARCGFLSIVQVLISYAADLDCRNTDYDTPLLIAARVGVQEIVSELVHAGANLYAINSDGESALQVACAHNHFSCVETLLRAGADPSLLGPTGRLPLQYVPTGLLLHIRDAYEAAVPLHQFVCCPTLSDVVFRVTRTGVTSPACASSVPAHAVIVGTRCPQFVKVIEDAAQEDDGYSQMPFSMIQVPVELDCDADAFQAFLYYLYTDRLPWHAYSADTGPQLVSDLRQIAAQFDVQRLEAICACYLGSKGIVIPPSTLHKDLSTMRTSSFGQDFSDVTVVVEDESDFYPAHRVIMAAFSPPFAETVLSAPTMAGSTDHAFFTIPSKYDAAFLPILLGTVYGQGAEQYITPHNYIDLVKFMHVYGSDHALQVCEAYMRQRLNDGNVLQFLRSASSYPRMQHIRSYCLLYCAFRILVLRPDDTLCQRMTPALLRDMQKIVPSRWRSTLSHNSGQHGGLSDSEDETDTPVAGSDSQNINSTNHRRDSGTPRRQSSRNRQPKRVVPESPMTDCRVPSPAPEKVAFRDFSNPTAVQFLGEGHHIERIRTMVYSRKHGKSVIS